MQYVKTVNLWDAVIQHSINSGQLKLQTGQWCTCGTDNPKPCRYVSCNPLTVFVIHWAGDSSTTQRKFIKACKLRRLAR